MLRDTTRGIVRPARRPPGWRAPGPAPAGDPALGPWPGEDLCYLAGDWRILQRLDGHRWSLDDLVTAWFAAAQLASAPPARVADLGCGIGTVLLLLAWRFPAARCVGVEAQAVSVDLARRSLAWNQTAGRCEVREGDLRDPALIPEGPVFDLVTGTPPYLPPGTAIESQRVQCGPAHIEHRGGIEEYCLSAARVLARGGCFVACAGGRQEERVRAAAAGAGLTIERQRAVIPRAGKDALLAVYAMRRAGGEGPRAIGPPLVVRDERGRRTDEFRALRADMGMPP